LRLNFERRRAANIGTPTLTFESGFNAFFPYSNRDNLMRGLKPEISPII